MEICLACDALVVGAASGLPALVASVCGCFHGATSGLLATSGQLVAAGMHIALHWQFAWPQWWCAGDRAAASTQAVCHGCDFRSVHKGCCHAASLAGLHHKTAGSNTIAGKGPSCDYSVAVAWRPRRVIGCQGWCRIVAPLRSVVCAWQDCCCACHLRWA